jgi:hypothetical protein
LGHHLLALQGKRPHPKYHEEWDWDNSIHGAPETAEEHQALISVFRDKTVTGLAILIPEHVLVADVDTEAAAALFVELAGGMPDTVAAQTKNGLHLWFLAPGADGSLWLGDRTLLFKGFGGYVVAPPSAHFDEHGEQDFTYTWIKPMGGAAGFDWLPDGIAARARAERALSAGKPAVEHGNPVSMEPEIIDGRWTGRGWGVLDIEGLRQAIIHAKDGNQNNVIYWAACTARDEGVAYEDAMTQLLSAANEGHHPIERAKSTIRGAYKVRGRG